MSGSRNAAGLLVALLAHAAAAAPSIGHAVPDADTRFATLEHTYVVYCMSRFPVMATYLGGSAFDPSLADVDATLRDDSPAAIAAEDAHLRELRTQFAQAEPRHLSARLRVDRTIALAQIEFLLHEHDVLHRQQSALDAYVLGPAQAVQWQLQGMTPTGAVTLGTEAQWQRLITRVRAVPAYLTRAREQLAAGVRAGRVPDWRVLISSGLQATSANADYFSKALAAAAQPLLTGTERDGLLRQLQQAGRDAGAAYQALHDYVADSFFQDPMGTDVKALKVPYRSDRFALGEIEYDWALHNNLHVDSTAAALYPQSWPAVQADRAQLVAVARGIAQSHHWQLPAGPAENTVRMVFGHLELDAPSSDAALLDAYRQLGERLVDYARTTHLFDVPPQYHLDVKSTPLPLRSAIESAAYYPQPVYAAQGRGQFYVTPTGDDALQLQQRHNRAAQAVLAVHEGFPGHDWHYQVMIANRATISPLRWLTPGGVEDSASMWEDSMATEGWALYAENLMAEPQPGAPHGFYSPEEHLYQLRAQLSRDLRVRIDTGLHTGRLSFEDAVTLVSEVVDFNPGSCHDPRTLVDAGKRESCALARGAIDRYARWPTQAVTYRLGEQQILALRRRAQRLFGAEFSEQRFHLELMKQGSVPIGYFAEDLLRALGRPAGG